MVHILHPYSVDMVLVRHSIIVLSLQLCSVFLHSLCGYLAGMLYCTVMVEQDVIFVYAFQKQALKLFALFVFVFVVDPSFSKLLPVWLIAA